MAICKYTNKTKVIKLIAYSTITTSKPAGLNMRFQGVQGNVYERFSNEFAHFHKVKSFDVK